MEAARKAARTVKAAVPQLDQVVRALHVRRDPFAVDGVKMELWKPKVGRSRRSEAQEELALHLSSLQLPIQAVCHVVTDWRKIAGLHLGVMEARTLVLNDDDLKKQVWLERSLRELKEDAEAALG